MYIDIYITIRPFSYTKYLNKGCKNKIRNPLYVECKPLKQLQLGYVINIFFYLQFPQVNNQYRQLNQLI